MFGKKKKLLAAARANDVAGVRKYSMRGQAHFDACLEAIKHNAPDALQAMLKRRGYDFAEDVYEDAAKARALLGAIHQQGTPEELYLVFYEANRHRGASTQLGHRRIMSEKTPLKAIQNWLEQDSGKFEDCLCYIGLADTEKLKFILSFTPKSKNGQHALNIAVGIAAEKGDVEKAGLLLQRGANPDYADAQALERAAENGHADMVNLLLPLVSLENHGADIVTKLQHKGSDKAIIDTIDAATRLAVKTAPAQTAPAATPAENYTRLDDHTLEDRQTLSDGSTLTSVFNFTTRQQIIARSAEGVPPAPLVVIQFDDLGADVISGLKEKFDALASEQTAANENTRKKPELASQGITKRLNGAGL